MKQEDFMNVLSGQLRLSDEAEKRFSLAILENMRGTVRINAATFLTTGIITVGVGGMLFDNLGKMPGLLGMLLLILFLGGAVWLFWYYFTWRIEFDASTEFIQCYSLLNGMDSYHVSELMRFETKVVHTRSKNIKMLVIPVENRIISIPLAAAWMSKDFDGNTGGGYTGADKFYAYLDLYRRLKYEKNSINSWESDLSPAVQQAIAEERRMRETAAIPKEMPALTEAEFPTAGKVKLTKWMDETPSPTLPDISVPVAPEPETQKSGSAQEKMAERPVMPERSSTFPDPTRSVFADSKSSVPADKPDVDVDALFEQVLQQHGKTRDTSVQKRPAQDSLLEQVFRMNRH